MNPATGRELERLEEEFEVRSAPIWWGLLLLVIIEALAFATLITSYFYLGFRHASWPPEGVQLPDRMLGSAVAVALLASSAAFAFGQWGIRRGGQLKLQVGLALSTLLVLGALGLQVTERALVDYRWDDHAYGSVVWITVGIHAMHVLVLAVMGMLLCLLALRGHFTRERWPVIQAVGMLWHFVAVTWVVLLVIIYLLPHGW